MAARLDFFFDCLEENGASVNVLLNASPKGKSSPQPPHLKSPGGGSVGKRPQLHLVVAPSEQALDTDWATAAADRAYTNACSRLPAKQK